MEKQSIEQYVNMTCKKEKREGGIYFMSDIPLEC